MAVQITVIGAGAWGTTIASLVAAKGPVTLWAFEPEVVAAVNDDHRNPVYLPEIDLSPDLVATADLRAATADAEVVLMAVPSQHFRAILERAAPGIGPETPFLSLTKGIESRTLLRMSEVAAELLVGHRRERVGVLSGPNIAREVAHAEPAADVAEALLGRTLTTELHAGRSTTGAVVGVQFGAKWTEGTGFTENGVIIDGRVTKIGQELIWDYDRDRHLDPWRVHHPDGSLDLTLRSFHMPIRAENRAVIPGSFTGVNQRGSG